MEFLKTHRGIFIGLGLLALFLIGMGGLVAATGWEDTRKALLKINATQLGILLALSLINYLTRAARWHILARALDIPLKLGRNTVFFLGGFALTLTPARIGELIRLRWIKRATGIAMMQSTPIILGDRAADLAGVALLLLVAALSSYGDAGGVYGAVLLAVALAFLATNPRFMAWGVTLLWRSFGRFGRFFAGLRRAAKRLSAFAAPKTSLPVLALSGIGWFAEAYAFYLLLAWLGADIPLWTAVAIFLFAMLGGGASGMPGGLGGAEAAMLVLLSLQNVPLDIALAATLVIRATTLWFAILIGVIVFPVAEYGRAKNAVEKR